MSEKDTIIARMGELQIAINAIPSGSAKRAVQQSFDRVAGVLVDAGSVNELPLPRAEA
jgi:hypothetical protein